MRDKTEKPLHTLTSGQHATDSVLTGLLRLSDRYEVLDAKIQGVLSPKLRGQVQVAQVKNATLVLAARTSAWVARAQLEAHNILQVANDTWDEPINQIKVIVGPGTSRTQGAP